MAKHPLDPLYPTPGALLEKAKRDAQRFEAATLEQDLTGAADAFLDAASTIYHLKDWVAAKHPKLKAAAQQLIDASGELLLCRDVCIATKHVGYWLEQKPFNVIPPRVGELDHTAVATTGTYAGLPTLKVFVNGGYHYANDVVRDSIRRWEAFLTKHGID